MNDETRFELTAREPAPMPPLVIFSSEWDSWTAETFAPTTDAELDAMAERDVIQGPF